MDVVARAPGLPQGAWMWLQLIWLQLMWLQFEVVRGPADLGLVWGFEGPQIDPKGARPDLGQPQIAAT